MNRANQRRGEASNQHLHTAAQNALPPASFERGDGGTGQPEHGHSQPRALNISHRVEHSDECSMVRSSSCGAGGECGRTSPRSSPERCDECAEILHQLANVITGIVVNAQMLDWKLPPYSRIKRPMVEIERSAQRGSELLKGLQQRLAQSSAQPQAGVDELAIDSLPMSAIAPPPPRIVKGQSFLRHSAPAKPVADGISPTPELTMGCDRCTSVFFPKRDDGR